MDNLSRRKFYRTDFKVNATFKCNSREYSLFLINISLKGVLTESSDETDLKKNDNGVLIVHLPNSSISITIADATIIHCEGDKQYGFIFNEIDAESMIHLRRLLELNSVFEGEIENELTHLKDT